MNTNTVDAKMLGRMFLAGAKNLEAKKEWINELNVFPVPDGDTGTNMTLTILSAASEVNALSEPSMKTLAKAIASGSLRGARGNSGVILSQLLRGFAKVIEQYEEVDAPIFAKAFEKGVETAYKAVMKPKEGTILTVAKGAAAKADELAEEAEDLNTFFEGVIAYAQEVLSQTPEMLPVLKEAGVVDSGGQAPHLHWSVSQRYRCSSLLPPWVALALCAISPSSRQRIFTRVLSVCFWATMRPRTRQCWERFRLLRFWLFL